VPTLDQPNTGATTGGLPLPKQIEISRIWYYVLGGGTCSPLYDFWTKEVRLDTP